VNALGQIYPFAAAAVRRRCGGGAPSSQQWSCLAAANAKVAARRNQNNAGDPIKRAPPDCDNFATISTSQTKITCRFNPAFSEKFESKISDRS